MYESIKEQEMNSLSDFQRGLYKEPQLRNLFFELTDSCNLNCRHCGSRCTGRNKGFLPFMVVERVLRSVAGKYEPSKIRVCLTGGEPLLHPRLFDIISLSHRMGFGVGMTTNGTLIDERKAYQLAAAGIEAVTISIDGIGKVHDDFRGMPGAFDKAMEGIHNLRKFGIEPQPLTVVHKGNYFQLEELFQYLKADGCYSWRLTNVDPIGRAAEGKDVLLSSLELKGMFDFMKEKRSTETDMDVMYGCAHFLGLEYEKEVRDPYFQCGAGTTVASVMVNGNIGACLDIERRPDLVQGNAFRDDFVKIWEERFEVFRRDRTELSNKCRGCEHRNICLGDSAHTWDYDNNEPILCMAEKLKGAKNGI